MNPKTHTTALVLIPPEDLWQPIQALRKQHDRNVRRWMPHITLLYPFAPPAAFADLVPGLGAACTNATPFTITLTHFGAFAHGQRGATIFLVPEPAEPLVALQTRLWEVVPAYDDTRRHRNGFTPHLSVGQTRGGAEARALVETLSAQWQPLTFTASAVQLIWRSKPPDDTFRVAHSLLVGAA
jgi:2'-5' RNA ligase